MTDAPTVRMTYAELARARGISVDSARRMTVRRRWPKQVGNDGLTRVDVPTDALEKPKAPIQPAITDAGRTPPAAPDIEAMIAAIVSGVTAATDAMLAELRLQLTRERERADRAEAALDAQAAEHSRIVATLTERIPRPRRRWWRL